MVVQVLTSDGMRAHAMAIWTAAFVGLLPLGAHISAALVAWLGAGGAVLIDGLVRLAGGLLVIARRPALRWLGCVALPEACLGGSVPAALAIERELHTQLLDAVVPGLMRGDGAALDGTHDAGSRFH